MASDLLLNVYISVIYFEFSLCCFIENVLNHEFGVKKKIWLQLISVIHRRRVSVCNWDRVCPAQAWSIYKITITFKCKGACSSHAFTSGQISILVWCSQSAE